MHIPNWSVWICQSPAICTSALDRYWTSTFLTLRNSTFCRVHHHMHDLAWKEHEFSKSTSGTFSDSKKNKRKKTCRLWKWALTELLRVASFNGLPCIGYSSSRAGADKYTAVVFCIPGILITLQRKRQSDVQYASLCHLCDACLLKGFAYHKAASRWLRELHRNASCEDQVFLCNLN